MRVIKQGGTDPVMILMVDSTDHATGKTGLTLAVSISKAGGAFNSVSSPTVAERGNGWYAWTPSAANTDTLGDLVIRATASGADPGERVAQVVAYDPADAAGLGLSRVDAAVSSRLSAAGYTVPPTTGAIVTAMDTNSTKLANLDAAVSTRSTYSGGPVASVTAPVTVGTNNDKGGYSLAAGGADLVTPETGVNIKQALSLIMAAVAGQLSGAATNTVVIKNPAGTATRLTVTTDADGNRTLVVTNPPA